MIMEGPLDRYGEDVCSIVLCRTIGELEIANNCVHLIVIIVHLNMLCPSMEDWILVNRII